MDLEQLLQDARPDTAPDLSRQNALVYAALIRQAKAVGSRRQSWLGRFCFALVEAPIPTLTVGTILLSFVLWQASVLLGDGGLWINRAAALILNGGMLP